jgi:hypothetical protein
MVSSVSERYPIESFIIRILIKNVGTALVAVRIRSGQGPPPLSGFHSVQQALSLQKISPQRFLHILELLSKQSPLWASSWT